jgi:hypothetical protein
MGARDDMGNRRLGWRCKTRVVQAAMLAGAGGFMIASTASAQADGKRYYRYRDAHGVVQVSSILPPGQAQAGYEILDGVSLRVLSVVAAAPTAQELAGVAAARREAALARAAAEEAAQQRRRDAQSQQQRDQMLLQTYASEAELLALRDRKLQTIDLIRQTLDQTIAYLRANLERMDATIGEHRTAGREPPPELLAARARTADDLAEQSRAAERTQAEQATVRRRFDDDLQRYRQLTQSL